MPSMGGEDLCGLGALLRTTPSVPGNGSEATKNGGAGSGTVRTQQQFRRALLSQQRDRLLRSAEGRVLRLYPTMMNGDCGFSAVARGVTLVRRPPPQSNNSQNQVPLSKRVFRSRGRPRMPPAMTAREVRVLARDEARRRAKEYSQALQGAYTAADFAEFQSAVCRPGMRGHWLGAKLGFFELVIVANALKANVVLYMFDVQRQNVRCVDEVKVDKAQMEISLLFTGPPEAGHFDLLVRISDPVVIKSYSNALQSSCVAQDEKNEGDCEENSTLSTPKDLT